MKMNMLAKLSCSASHSQQVPLSLQTFFPVTSSSPPRISALRFDDDGSISNSNLYVLNYGWNEELIKNEFFHKLEYEWIPQNN